MQQRDGEHLASGKLRRRNGTGRQTTLKTKEIYEWSEIGHEVCMSCKRRESRMLGWMEAELLLEKE